MRWPPAKHSSDVQDSLRLHTKRATRRSPAESINLCRLVRLLYEPIGLPPTLGSKRRKEKSNHHTTNSTNTWDALAPARLHRYFRMSTSN